MQEVLGVAIASSGCAERTESGRSAQLFFEGELAMGEKFALILSGLVLWDKDLFVISN